MSFEVKYVGERVMFCQAGENLFVYTTCHGERIAWEPRSGRGSEQAICPNCGEVLLAEMSLQIVDELKATTPPDIIQYWVSRWLNIPTETVKIRIGATNVT